MKINKKYDVRNRRLMYNTITAIVSQCVAIVCGFILPRITLECYGSEVNGLVNSITQFLAIVSLLDFGIGAVVQTSYYKPLSEENMLEASKVTASSDKFFRKLGVILGIYMMVLIFAYPKLTNTTFDFLYTALLIIIIGMSSISQYMLGVTDRCLLEADQRGYINSITHIVTTIVDTVVCVILIKVGQSIFIVKLSVLFIYVLRLVAIRIYIKANYDINRRVKYEEEPIKQKWNGVAQHISYFVLEHTDSIVLTMFASLTDVSVYAVYNMVVSKIKSIIGAFFSGYRSLFGELWAKNDKSTLSKYYHSMEWMLHMIAVFVWGCTVVLIIPFVQVYTKNVIDADYVNATFAYLIVAANFFHSLRYSYNTMIIAAGHYKQTQSCYLVSAFLNIIISVVLVIKLGLVGVAIGTLIAMLYQTIWMGTYCYKNLVITPLKKIVKLGVTDFLTVMLIFMVVSLIDFNDISWIGFLVICFKVVITAIIIIIIMNTLFYRDKLKMIFAKIKNSALSIN